MSEPVDRRSLLGASLLLGLAPGSALAAAPKAKPAEVNATEDLMREHGVLRRVLGLYDEGVRRLVAGESPIATLGAAAGIVQRFIEGYHEKLEEQFVFPRMQQAGKRTELVQVLLAQHVAGRKVTADILAASTVAGVAGAEGRQALIGHLHAFARMYRPHAAREDTDLFPAYQALFSEKEFDALGDRFEEQEHRLVGSGGFEGAVKEVAELESAFGVHDLARFTPG